MIFAFATPHVGGVEFKLIAIHTLAVLSHSFDTDLMASSGQQDKLRLLNELHLSSLCFLTRPALTTSTTRLATGLARMYSVGHRLRADFAPSRASSAGCVLA